MNLYLVDRDRCYQEMILPRRGGLVVRIPRACVRIHLNPGEYWGWEVGALMRCALLLALLDRKSVV